MKIAIGSDHRGAKIAKKLMDDVFLRNHYGQDELGAESKDGVTGAFLIEGVDLSEDFDASERTTIEQSAKITPIHYVYSTPQPTPPEDAPSNVDYPDVAAAVADAVSSGRADYGALICGAGIGMCISANKFRGVRAALCYNQIAAELSRRHNNANVLCLPGEFLGASAIESIVRVWLTTPFDGGRHQRRLDRISEIERETGL